MPRIPGHVRRYLPADRTALKAASARVDDAFSRAWRHRESADAVWLAPYLDNEPDSSFVAIVDGSIVGYLTGCLDTASFQGPDQVMMDVVAKHRLMFRPGVAGFLWRAMFDTMLDKARGLPIAEGVLHDPRWPSHFHINLVPEARGMGLGRALMEAWFKRLDEKHSPGCHLGVIAENASARAFFGAMGFSDHGAPLLLQGLRGADKKRLHQQVMVRDASMH